MQIVQRLVLVDGQRGAHRRDDVRQSGLMGGDRVEVALHDHDLVLPARFGFRRVKGVERRALVEQHRLR